MEESNFVNEWVAAGEARGEARGLVQEARSILLRLGKKRFGPAPAGVEAALQAVTERDWLEQIADHVLNATSWDDLLDAGREDLWPEHLREWNVEESKIVNGWIATGETRGEARGLIQGARNAVLRLAKKRFGPAPAGVEAAIQAATDRDRLEQIGDRVLDATSWDDLLATT